MSDGIPEDCGYPLTCKSCGASCWKDTRPTPKECAECLCWRCVRGQCPPALIYSGRFKVESYEHLVDDEEIEDEEDEEQDDDEE